MPGILTTRKRRGRSHFHASQTSLWQHMTVIPAIAASTNRRIIVQDSLGKKEDYI
jgi:hypothetical protein